MIINDHTIAAASRERETFLQLARAHDSLAAVIREAFPEEDECGRPTTRETAFEAAERLLKEYAAVRAGLARVDRWTADQAATWLATHWPSLRGDVTIGDAWDALGPDLAALLNRTAMIAATRAGGNRR